MIPEPWTHKAYRALAGVWPARKARAGMRVLMYHSVGGALPEDPYGTSIAPSLFAAQMDILAETRGRWKPAPFGSASGDGLEIALTFDDGYRDTLTAAAPVLARLNLPMTVFVAPAHVKRGGPLYLNRAELKQLADLPGVVIGAHGDAHVPLDALDDASLARELSESRKFLEDALGRPVTAMSYPFGRVDGRVRAAAQAAGFTRAGCSLYGLNEPDRDPLLLRRTEITAWDDAVDFQHKIEGRWDWFALRQRDPAGR